MLKSPKWLVMLMMVLVLVLAACTAETEDSANETDDNGQNANSDSDNGANDGEDESANQVLRMVMPAEPTVLDPQVSTDPYSINVNNAIREGLVRYHNGEIIPGIAEDWDISEDGLTYTFNLRKSTWSDGSELTAQDFKDSFIRLMNPATNSPYAYIGYYVKNAQAFNKGEITDPEQVGVKVVDPYTLEYTLESPTKQFLSLTSFLSYLPSNAAKVKESGQDYSSNPDTMLYNGPFILKDWKHQESFTLEKNPNYWNKDEVTLETVEIAIVPDDGTAASMYEADEIDMVSLGREYVEKYEQAGEAEFYNKGTISFMQYSYKGEVGEIFSNSNFRKAISHVINRQGIVDGVLKDGSTVAERYIMPTTLGVKKSFGEEYPLSVVPAVNDNEKAEEFLATALDELGMTKDELPTFELLASDRPNDRIISEAIQDMLDQSLGIKTDIKIVPHDQRIQLLLDSDFEMMWAGWGPDYNDPMTYLDIFTSTSGYNTTGFNDSTYDDLINSANEEPDFEVRADILFEAEKYLIENGPMTPVFFAGGAWTRSDDLKNVNMGPFGAEVDFAFGYFE